MFESKWIIFFFTIDFCINQDLQGINTALLYILRLTWWALRWPPWPWRRRRRASPCRGRRCLRLRCSWWSRCAPTSAAGAGSPARTGTWARASPQRGAACDLERCSIQYTQYGSNGTGYQSVRLYVYWAFKEDLDRVEQKNFCMSEFSTFLLSTNLGHPMR